MATKTAYRQFVRHIAVGPDQLEAQAPGGLAQRALLAPAERTFVLLFSGGDADLPLLLPGKGLNDCKPYSSWDRAGYRLGSFNCLNPGLEGPAEDLVLDSLRPADWRLAHSSLSVSEYGFVGLSRFESSVCAGRDQYPINEVLSYRGRALHYPHEALQSLTAMAGQWLLLTRQHYPWHRALDDRGLLRVTRYLLPQHAGALPLTTADVRHGGVGLYQPPGDKALAADARPVSSLVQGSLVFQLYQTPDQAVELVSLPFRVTDGHYQLSRYDTLAGQARLLSEEQGELHLWMQQDNNDTLLVYGLGELSGSGNISNSSSWLHWGFDLSDQPGGRALLARAGDWLYSLRQEEGQPASLRRFHVETGQMDADWQPAWQGNMTDLAHLVVNHDRLTALPAGTLVDPQGEAEGLQARVPDTGGCLQWSRLALEQTALLETTSSPATTSARPSVAAVDNSLPWMAVVLGGGGLLACLSLGTVLATTGCCGTGRLMGCRGQRVADRRTAAGWEDGEQGAPARGHAGWAGGLRESMV